MPAWVEPITNLLLYVLLLVVPFLWLGGFLVSRSVKPRAPEPAPDDDVPRAQVVLGGHSPLREKRPSKGQLVVRVLQLGFGLVSLGVGLAWAAALVFMIFYFYG